MSPHPYLSYRFERNYANGRRNAESDPMSRAQSDSLKAEASEAWGKVSEDERNVWEARARSHDAEQPLMLGRIREALSSNPTMSWAQLEGATGGWCSGDTMRRLFVFLNGETYMERICPLLSPAQMLAHVEVCVYGREMLFINIDHPYTMHARIYSCATYSDDVGDVYIIKL